MPLQVTGQYISKPSISNDLMHIIRFGSFAASLMRILGEVQKLKHPEGALMCELFKVKPDKVRYPIDLCGCFPLWLVLFSCDVVELALLFFTTQPRIDACP